MFKRLSIIALLLSALALAACSDDSKAEGKAAKQVEGKWYNTAQLMRGKKVFKENCAECHGDQGQGLVKDWQKPQADGKFPAPPLNGTAHTWHHSKKLLLRTVNMGGIPLGGSMPAFKDKLTEKEKEAALAHVMSLWPDNIYDAWAKRNPG